MSWVIDALGPEEKQLADEALDVYAEYLTSGNIRDQNKFELGEQVYKTVLSKDVVFFGNIYLPDHFSHTEAKFHKPLSKMLHQRTFIAVAAPRGHAKSSLVSLAHCLHEAAMKRASFIMIIGNTGETAADHLDALIGELVENTKLQADFPHLAPADPVQLRKERKRKKRQRQTDFVTSGGVRFVARGAGQPLRGSKEGHVRPDLIVLDDVDDDKTVRSEKMRENLMSWFDKVVMNLEGVAQARVRVVGTIISKHGLLPKLIERWNGTVWKAVVDWESQEVQWPEVWNFNRLMVKRDGGYDNGVKIKGVGHIVFAQEYQNDPKQDEGHPLREAWIKRSLAVPNGLRQSGLCFIGVDLALAEKEKSSYNALVVHIYDKRTEQTYVMDALRWRAPINETKRIIKECVHFWKPQLTAIEAVQFQMAVVQQMIEEMPMYLFAGVTPDRDKAARFQLLANQYSLRSFNHLQLADLENGIIPQTGEPYPWTGRLPQKYEAELLDFPDIEFGDWADASVYAFLARFMPYGSQVASTAILIQDMEGTDW